LAKTFFQQFGKGLDNFWHTHVGISPARGDKWESEKRNKS
jgi:hypothetical protein